MILPRVQNVEPTRSELDAAATDSSAWILFKIKFAVRIIEESAGRARPPRRGRCARRAGRVYVQRARVWASIRGALERGTLL